VAARAADSLVARRDPRVAGGREPRELINDALTTLLGIGIELAESRRARPADDLMTSLVQAEVDGHRLTDEEIGAFFALFSVAENSTVHNTISLGMKAFCDFPQQRTRLLRDFGRSIRPAVEEVIRWVTPVVALRRTAMRDTTLGGRRIAEGEWVVLFYTSGNRDDRVFADPYEFDILRDPNDHLGFGSGPHFYLVSALARSQLRAVFDQLLHRAPNLALGEPRYMASTFLNAVTSMPCKPHG
jgi:cytochrome P450